MQLVRHTGAEMLCTLNQTTTGPIINLRSRFNVKSISSPRYSSHKKLIRNSKNLKNKHVNPTKVRQSSTRLHLGLLRTKKGHKASKNQELKESLTIKSKQKSCSLSALKHQKEYVLVEAMSVRSVNDKKVSMNRSLECMSKSAKNGPELLNPATLGGRAGQATSLLLTQV